MNSSVWFVDTCYSSNLCVQELMHGVILGGGGWGVGGIGMGGGQQVETSTLPLLLIPSPPAPPFPLSAPVLISKVVEPTLMNNSHFPSDHSSVN